MRTDEALLWAVGQADRTAFQELYDRHADRVYRFALSLVRNGTLAEEVLQETMLAVWRQGGKFRGSSKATTWILGIARNQAHSLLRREKKGQRLPDDPEFEADPAEVAEVDVRVKQALEKLSSEHQEALHLVFYEELSVAETAAVLGVPEGTVKSRLFYARKALAKELL